MAKQGRKVKKIAFTSLAALALLLAGYYLGLNVGNGRIDFSSSANSELPATLNYSSVNQEYQTLKNNYNGKLTANELLDGIKHGLATAVNDPYTEYFTAQESKQFSNELNNTFSGIGAQLSANSQKQIVVVAPLAGTPAAKAGLMPNDIIADINGKPTTNMNVDEAVNAIRGKAGTSVSLSIVRNDVALTLKITRQNITVPSVTYKILSGNIGYIAISSFAEDTSHLIAQAAQNMLQNHVKGIVLDLRNNPGGLVSAAVAVSSEWLKPGQEIMEERQDGTVIQTYNATGGDILNNIPTVVLVNDGSASASEITAGALHDNHDGYIIGTKSFGKGVVQQLINLADGGELKVTVADWYRPNGQDINHKGITPDQTVNPTSNGSDNQLTAAEQYLTSH